MPEPKVRPAAQVAAVLPGYFEVMQIPLLRGRTFSQQDENGSERTAIINEEFAHLYFPGQVAIGKLVANDAAHDQTARIVGVVGNVANDQLGGPASPEIYWPGPARAMYLVARVNGNIHITSAVRDQIAKLNSHVALFDVAMMPERLAASLRLRRFIVWLMNGFALIGLALAAIGFYGALAHSVEMRRREIAIRVALGAVPQDVTRLIAQEAGAALMIGLSLGLVGSFGVQGLIRSQLFGVSSEDGLSWAFVLTVILVTAIAAAGQPLRRALRVQPAELLREE